MNFKHLYYFWVAAKAGGVMRAGEQLHTTPADPVGSDQTA
jgi:LysR family transcriptional activator of nhaA